MSRNKLIKEYLIIHILCGTAFIITAFAFLLQQKGILLSNKCVFWELTHLYCPGCGGTRALFALLHGHFMQSLVLNPAVILGALVIIYYEIGAIITIVKNDGKCHYDKKGIPIYIYFSIVMVFAIIRNILLLKCGIDWFDYVIFSCI